MKMYQFQMKGQQESLEVLYQAHEDHTFDCCPDVHDIEFTERNAAIKSLVGEYPVYGSPMSICNEIKNRLCEMLRNKYYGDKLDGTMYSAISDVLRGSSSENWSENVIEKNRFDKLKKAIAEQPEFSTFQLVKKSSPKISNLVASVLKYCDRDPQNDELVKLFNARQSDQMKDHTLYISIEPHRIIGMSAFGLFNSCQDWIVKDTSHDYHNYTHQAWANMLDGTCGIAYIRKNTNEDEPTEEKTNVQDMCARSLVRAITLPNGHIMVYLGRVYGASPYDQVIRETFNRWEKTLPENVHVIKMYDNGRDPYRSGKNKYGVEYNGYKIFTEEQVSCVLAWGSTHTCNTCEGTGDRTCPCCGGNGIVYVNMRGYDSQDNEYVIADMEFDCLECHGEGTTECNNCDGQGTWESRESERPYNDHSDWITFTNHGPKYQVPEYILNWDVEPAKPIEPNKEVANLKVGDKVRIKPRDAFQVGVQCCSHNGTTDGRVYFTNSMAHYCDKVVTITSISDGYSRIAEDAGEWCWTNDMIAEVNPSTEIKVGTLVKVRRDLVGAVVDETGTLQDFMLFDGVRRVSLIDGMCVKVEDKPYTYTKGMFEIVNEGVMV